MFVAGGGGGVRRVRRREEKLGARQGRRKGTGVVEQGLMQGYCEGTDS